MFSEIINSQSKTSMNSCLMQGKTKLSFDSSSKEYLLCLDSASVTVPRHERNSLEIMRQEVVLQVLIYPGTPLVVEVCVTDSEGIQRRLVFDKSKGLGKGALMARIPNSMFQRGVWVNLCIDLASVFAMCFASSVFRTLDKISIFGTLCLRKVVSVISPAVDYLPRIIEQRNCTETFQEITKNTFAQVLSQFNSPARGRNYKSPRERYVRKQIVESKEYRDARNSKIKASERYREIFKSPCPRIIRETLDLSKTNGHHSISLTENVRQKSKKSKNFNIFMNICTEKRKSVKIKEEAEEKLPTYFHYLSSKICSFRPVTPPFVNSSDQVYYNPIDKQYNKLE